jgi:HD superfamily phosphohydrolase
MPLRKKKREYDHKPIWQRNSHVPQVLSEWVDELITPEDETRPNAERALAALKLIRDQLDKVVAAPSVTSNGRIKYAEVIRDPLHGDIRVTETEYKIIHTPEFVRLRKLKQLGFAYIPFPGAEHTRYLHSLGCVFVTERILRSIEDITGISISPADRLLARAYALVHDVIHIPFGHTLEDELGLFGRHDRNHKRTSETILNEKSTLGTLLFSSEIDRVRDFFQRDLTGNRLAGFKELQESVVGADVLDYIDRDALFCGLDHRIDSALYRRFRLRKQMGGVDDVQGNFYTTMYGTQGVRLDAEFAAETIFLERFALYLKVYTHPQKLCAGAMLGKALWDHTRLGENLDRFEADIGQMGDADLLSLLTQKGRTASVKEIGAMLQEETLFEAVYRASLMNWDSLDHPTYVSTQEQLAERGLTSPAGRSKAEKALAKTAGVSESQIIVYCPASSPGYAKIRQWVESEQGHFEEHTEAHPMHQRVQRRHLALWTAYVFCHPSMPSEDKARVASAAQQMFGKANTTPMKIRQLLFFDY